VLALPAGSAPNVLNKSFAITADIDVRQGASDGAIFSLGGTDGGFGLYVRDGRPVFVGNFLGRTYSRATSAKPLPPGPATLRAVFTYDGGGLGQGGKMALFVDGQQVGEARMAQTHAIGLGLGGTLDIGEDTGSPVDEAYAPPFRFAGTIRKVTVDLKPN
jgi:arylsulfatase